MLIAEQTTSDEIHNFLRSLDNKLHFKLKARYCRSEGYNDQFNNDEKLSIDELEKILEQINDDTNLALHPVNTNFGFSLGYEILDCNKMDQNRLLMFLDKQLPEGYDFNRLSLIFLREDNVDRLENIGLEKPHSCRGRYEH